MAIGGSSPRFVGHGERGAIVLLAIAFIAVLSVIFIALLAYAYTGSASLRSYRIERTRRYAADAALQSAVQRMSDEPLTDTSVLGDCLTFPIVEQAGDVDVPEIVAPNSVVTVTCVDTPGASVGAADADGGQGPRDITFEVICTNGGSMVVDRRLACGSGGTDTVIGSARVRFEVNYDTAMVPPDRRAVIPKVISWSIRPQP